MGYRNAGTFFLAITVILPAIPAATASAEDIYRHDRRIELAAAQRAAERMGALRGSIAPQARRGAFFSEQKPLPLGFGLPGPRPDAPAPISNSTPVAKPKGDRLAMAMQR